MELGHIIVQGTDKSRANPWFLPQRADGVSTGQEATGEDRHRQGSTREEQDASARASVWVC